MKIHNFVMKHKKLHKPVIFLNDKAPKVMMVLFYGLMPILVVMRDIRVIAFAACPLIELTLVTKFRDKVDRPRPFDVLDITPLESHCSSSFVITTSLFYINPYLGIIGLIVSIVVAVTRLLVGVHYPLDVLTGILIGLAFGIPYLFL